MALGGGDLRKIRRVITDYTGEYAVIRCGTKVNRRRLSHMINSMQDIAAAADANDSASSEK